MAIPQKTASQRSTESAEDYTRAMAHGERALSLLKQLHIPAIPRNYALLYSFVTSSNKELCDALRKALEANSCLTDEDSEKLYEKYLQERQVPEKVGTVGSKVSQEMSEIMSVIEAASERAGSYGQSLKGFNAKLTAIESPEQLKTVLGELFDTNNNMAEYNEVLERRLANSKKQIDELQMSLELTRLESYIDEMTGLTNRKRFDQTLELDTSEAAESGEPLCLLMIDIDHFKAFNDTHGHQTGDKVLRLVGQILKTNVKGRDCAARFGGEEFAILLPKTKLAAAITLSEQIRAAIKSKELVKKSSGESLGYVTFSIGVAAYRPGESISEFIERADVCLYAAKSAGRDAVKAETDLAEISANVA